MDRRTALKRLLAGATVAATGPTVTSAREPAPPREDAVGMLYDATICIGCKACVTACKNANGDRPEWGGVPGEQNLDALYDAPIDLSGRTRNIIKLAKESDRTSFVKRQCMHCLDPACASVCMMGAMQKRRWGVVTYDVSHCIGCRYCQVACQFNIPKFEWDSPTPTIVKCEMCYHRLVEGGIPACCEACPAEAVVFGRYEELLNEAKNRIQSKPDRYEPHVYGETEGGGTQVLYLTAKGFDFEKLGLPDIGDEPVPELAETIQHGVYRGFIAPAALYAALGFVFMRHRRNTTESAEGEGATS